MSDTRPELRGRNDTRSTRATTGRTAHASSPSSTYHDFMLQRIEPRERIGPLSPARPPDQVSGMSFLRSQKLPLRLVLIVPYVILVVGLALALGVLSYSAGSNAVSTVSSQLLLEVVGRISQAVDRHVVGSSAVLETAFPEGMPAPKYMLVLL